MPQVPPSITTSGSADGPEQVGGAGVVTWTFDTDNMGWRSRDVFGDYGAATWANGAISRSFTNRTSSAHEPEDFASFWSPRLDPPLTGTGGSLSFTHTLSGGIYGVLFSVCLHYSSPNPLPIGYLPCTLWRPVTNGPVTFALAADGTWNAFDVFNMPLWPPYSPTPLTHEQMAAILKAVRSVRFHYVSVSDLCVMPKTACIHASTVTLDDVRLEVTGVSGKLGMSSLYPRDEDSVLFYAALKDNNGLPIRSSTEVSMTLSDLPGSYRLYDQSDAGDLEAGDGVYSRWENVVGEGAKKATLYYRGDELDSIDFTVTSHPHLVALTDIQALYQEFRHTGMPPGQDDDGNKEIDFYQMLDRLAQYAADHKGLVYDVRENIDTLHGFPLDYSSLEFAGSDPSSNRFRMAKLIDEALTRMHHDSGHTIGDIAIIGADDVIPFYRIKDASGMPIGVGPGVDTPTATDLAAGYLVTDVPFGTVDYASQDAVPRPSPQIPVGRITAAIPMGMIERMSAYAKPVVLQPGRASAALFIPADDQVHWEWLDHDLWTPLFTRRYALRDYRTAPPFEPGYYRYNGAVVKWDSDDILSALGDTDLTVLVTHGDNRCDRTMEPGWICGSDYGKLAPAGGRLYILEATFSGMSPAFYSPSGSGGAFGSAIPRWLQSVHRTQVGTTWLALGYNHSTGLLDYLMSNLAAQALNDGNSTVGDAFVHAWDGYWTTTGNNTAAARSTAYGMILWGLPTQPIQHSSPSVPTAAPVPTALEAPGAAGPATDGRSLDGQEAPAVDRSLSVEVNVPAFQVDADATGALLVLPANGGATFAEGPGLPLLPQVIKRFALPPDANDIIVTEDLAARVTQSYGAVRLQTAGLRPDCEGDCTIGAGPASVPIAGIYPSRAYTTEIQQRGDAIVLTLAAIPAQVAAAGDLTLFTTMKFTIAYKLPAAPAVAITGLAVNAGQAVRSGAAAVPLSVSMTSSTAQPITMTYALNAPSGFSIGSGLATTNLPKGASQVKLTMDATGWTPGPKVLSVTAIGPDGTLDTASASIEVLGLRLDAELTGKEVGVGAPVVLMVKAWDENGAAVAGLASRLVVQVDGAARAVAFTESPSGHYTGTVGTAGLFVGAHQMVVSATDSRGLAGEAWTDFETVRPTYLPLLRR